VILPHSPPSSCISQYTEIYWRSVRSTTFAPQADHRHSRDSSGESEIDSCISRASGITPCPSMIVLKTVPKWEALSSLNCKIHRNSWRSCDLYHRPALGRPNRFLKAAWRMKNQKEENLQWRLRRTWIDLFNSKETL
jgi:hypothetical protein